MIGLIQNMSVANQIGTNDEIAKPQEDNFLYFALEDCNSLPVCKQDSMIFHILKTISST